jgi:hypothetical protein
MQIFFGGYNEEILVGNLLLGCRYLRLGKANYKALVTKYGELVTQLAEKNAMMSRLVHQSGMNDNAIQIILRENPELLERLVELQDIMIELQKLFPPII